ncbi:AAA family ATPase [Actinocrispum wychmicini]|uniref:ClpA/ClpB-like protein n=1 Tax=Actinocrispum wychmicini TaxID=1213861 RepID=A0A4R2JAD9_9PSEU|nr:AAA family ATPase [Actinocrispum wychmicini]TCO52919.1 ClpA/ClpB-like protein [Actinocrispum wychmicini]
MADDTARNGPFLPGFPAFAVEVAGTLAVHSQYVLHGNIRDHFLVSPEGASPEIPPLLPLLWKALHPCGFEAFITYDAVDGIGVHPPKDPAALKAVECVLGPRAVGRRPGQKRLLAHLAKAVGVPEQPPEDSEAARSEQSASPAAPSGFARPANRVAFVIDYAARLTRVPGQLDQGERDFFLFCQKLAYSAQSFSVPGPRRSELHNPVIWLVEGERDLPAWFTAGVEPIRTVAVGVPTLDDRLRMARLLVPAFPPASTEDTHGRVDPAMEFANRTDGLSLESMMRIARLARDRGYGVDRIADATRVYKLGVDDNPWRRTSVRTQIIKGQQEISGQVMGQDRAVAKTLDILKRAALGMSGAQASTPGSRPRGVLFFAGPTGVGKTELAKQVAKILFGDPHAYLRFDMSEFSAEHAADRLIGAPPGYVGFEAGGELTGAIRRKPFQVVLFDEIEKAAPLVLDKFLQILEDGRLTDGQGETTYFSECVLIFTSNLGIIVTDPQTKIRTQIVRPPIDYKDLEKKVKGAIRDHFTNVLGRPELLNRFGDNIVVFDFISEVTATRIFSTQLDNIVARTYSELGVRLEITAEAAGQLCAACTAELDNGGRGIGNMLEANLVNTLSRVLFDKDAQPGDRVTVTGLRTGDHGPVLDAQVVRGGAA